MTGDPRARFERARRSLDGLSVGDAFGERFFGETATVRARIEAREPPPAPWPWTDDTAMAVSVVEALVAGGTIDPDRLASLFARRYADEPFRGYGGGAHAILTAVAQGMPWQRAARSVFGGTGSMGNGAAMRVAPLGAWFADAGYERVVDEARRSAEPTHAHPEGAAGAVAVAVAAAWAVRRRAGAEREALFDVVLRHTPPGRTARGIEAARDTPLDRAPHDAALHLGSGQRVLAEDTVPFTLWCVARHPDDCVEALWVTVAGLGDRDTTCAIVGGVVAAGAPETLPPAWIRAREPLPPLPQP